MAKIPCPSCREPNFDTDIVCWKCGEPLHKVDGPEVFQPTHTVQMDVSTSSAGLNRPAASDADGPVAGSDRVLAALIGAGIGALVSVLLNIPFLLWVNASSIPSAQALPFMLWMAAAGAVAGAVAATVRYGPAIAFLIYLAAFMAIRVYAMVSPITTPPPVHPAARRHRYGFYYQFAGLVIGYASLFGTGFILRRLGRNAALPAQSDSGSRTRNSAQLGAVLMLFLTAVAFSSLRHTSRIGRAADSPQAVVASYCRVMASGWDGDMRQLDGMMTRDLATRAANDPNVRTALNPPGLLDGVDSLNSRRPLIVPRVESGSDTGEVAVCASGGSTINMLRGRRPTGLAIITFKVRREAGRWRVADVPVRTEVK